MGVWKGPMGGAQPITAADISYSGSMSFASSGKNWEVALKSGSAATLRFLKKPGKVDIFLVAGGQSAHAYTPQESANQGPSHGAYGGNGGECVTETVKLQQGVDYSVTVGGSDANSSIVVGGTTYTARSGYGSAGGDGAVVQSSVSSQPEDGTDGVYAYGKQTDTLLLSDFSGHKFGAGGGGGGAHCGSSGAYSVGSLGGESNGDSHQYGKGGKYQVGYTGAVNGADGFANHGQGGGGACYWWTGSTSRHGDGTANAQGKGGSGIIIIRNHRE